jgi:hypothetical protein
VIARTPEAGWRSITFSLGGQFSRSRFSADIPCFVR